eukprot:IDg23354t1
MPSEVKEKVDLLLQSTTVRPNGAADTTVKNRESNTTTTVFQILQSFAQIRNSLSCSTTVHNESAADTTGGQRKPKTTTKSFECAKISRSQRGMAACSASQQGAQKASKKDSLFAVPNYAFLAPQTRQLVSKAKENRDVLQQSFECDRGSNSRRTACPASAQGALIALQITRDTTVRQKRIGINDNSRSITIEIRAVEGQPVLGTTVRLNSAADTTVRQKRIEINDRSRSRSSCYVVQAASSLYSSQHYERGVPISRQRLQQAAPAASSAKSVQHQKCQAQKRVAPGSAQRRQPQHQQPGALTARSTSSEQHQQRAAP